MPGTKKKFLVLETALAIILFFVSFVCFIADRDLGAVATQAQSEDGLNLWIIKRMNSLLEFFNADDETYFGLCVFLRTLFSGFRDIFAFYSENSEIFSVGLIIPFGLWLSFTFASRNLSYYSHLSRVICGLILLPSILMILLERKEVISAQKELAKSVNVNDRGHYNYGFDCETLQACTNALSEYSSALFDLNLFATAVLLWVIGKNQTSVLSMKEQISNYRASMGDPTHE